MKMTRPTWTELWKMQTKKDFDAAAARLFGDMPPRTDGAVPVPYRADQYQARLGIDVHQYTGFYAEVGHADAATGPVTPATERIKIHPILTIRQSNRGNFYVRSLSFAGSRSLWSAASVTRIRNRPESGFFGVPAICPVKGSRRRGSGRLPDSTLQW